MEISKTKQKKIDFIKEKNYLKRKRAKESKTEQNITNNTEEIADDEIKSPDIVENNDYIKAINNPEILKIFEHFEPNKNKINKDDNFSDIDGDALSENDFITNDKDVAKNKKERKKLKYNMIISDLKLATTKPDLVESWDITAKEPLFLIKLKTAKNTIPVPKHWLNKRKFLQNKRGVEVNSYKLPDYIQATGISKLRDPDLIDDRILKIKAKDKVNPKINKFDLDYNALYEAFFINQYKPPLTEFGQIYYEGKEYSHHMNIYKPGKLSDKLKIALGMNTNEQNELPPFLSTMRRYGAPPAYPNLFIPGVNCNNLSYATPNLWKSPVLSIPKSYIFNTKLNTKAGVHWGDLKELEEVYESDKEDDIALNDDDVIESNIKTNFKEETRNNIKSISY